MPTTSPPAPPRVEQPSEPTQAPIVDMRDKFERKGPPTDADRAAARAFVDGKIEMIRRDPHMSDEEKTAAIADLESRR